MTAKNSIYLHYANTLNSSFLYKKLGLNFPTNIFYIKDGEDEYFYVPFFEFDYLKKFSKNKNIKSLSELQGSNNNYFNAIINFLKRKNKAIIVPAFFPSWLFDKMTKNDLQVLIGDAYFFRTLLIKDESELGMIRETAESLKECFAYIKDILDRTAVNKGQLYFEKKILSSKSLSEIINIFLAARNIKCELPIIACGEFAYYPHCQKEHFLVANKPIIVDLGVSNNENGYYVDSSKTYFVGAPKYKKFIKLYNDITEVKSLLEENMKVGKLISEAYAKAVKMMSRRGIEIIRDKIPTRKHPDAICHHSLGHGVGRNLHQLPIVDKNAHVEFEENMVIAIEPGAYIKGIGGLRIEDTYLITKNGNVNLTGVR